MTAHLSPYQLAVQFFGDDHFTPMAFPGDVTCDDAMAVAEQLVEEGKARVVRVINSHTQVTLTEMGWQRYVK